MGCTVNSLPGQPCIGMGSTDLIIRTAGPGVIHSLGGNDMGRGLRGRDTICVGRGNDRSFGQRGRDLLSGQRGNDRLFAQREGCLNRGRGNDICNGGRGRDTDGGCKARFRILDWDRNFTGGRQYATGSTSTRTA